MVSGIFDNCIIYPNQHDLIGYGIYFNLSVEQNIDVLSCLLILRAPYGLPFLVGRTEIKSSIHNTRYKEFTPMFQSAMCLVMTSLLYCIQVHKTKATSAVIVMKG